MLICFVNWKYHTSEGIVTGVSFDIGSVRKDCLGKKRLDFGRGGVFKDLSRGGRRQRTRGTCVVDAQWPGQARPTCQLSEKKGVESERKRSNYTKEPEEIVCASFHNWPEPRVFFPPPHSALQSRLLGPCLEIYPHFGFSIKAPLSGGFPNPSRASHRRNQRFPFPVLSVKALLPL